jgi:hypothetical protein
VLDQIAGGIELVGFLNGFSGGQERDFQAGAPRGA